MRYHRLSSLSRPKSKQVIMKSVLIAKITVLLLINESGGGGGGGREVVMLLYSRLMVLPRWPDIVALNA